jgi:glutaconate CoA-transferase, subunit B
MREAAIIAASRLISEGNVVFVGLGLPLISSLFAKRTHAEKCVIMNEYGVVDTNPEFAVELAHPLFAESALYLCDMVDALGCLIYHVDIAFLGAAQIDRYGNANTTTVGNYFHPKYRISGSGGGNDIGSLAPKSLLIMDNQSPSKFPERVDYVTTPGFLEGPRSSRKKYNLLGGGPEIVVTNIGLYRFSKSTGEVYLDSLHDGVSVESARKNTGWKLKTAKEIKIIPPPTLEEVSLLRSLDPRKVYLR